MHITNFSDLIALLAVLPLDVSDRWTRQLGQFDLARILGAPLAATTNPVIAGLYGPSGDRLTVFPHDLSIPVSPAKIVINYFDTVVGATAEGNAAIVGTNVNHRGAGALSLEWNKTAGGVLGGVSYAVGPFNLSQYSTHAQVDFFIYVPTPVGGNIVQAYVALGTDNANLSYWAILAADLTLDAWNHVHLNMADITAVLGVGATLSAITYCAIYVQTDVIGATVTGILVDQLVVKRAFEVNVTNSLPTLASDGLTPTNVLSAGSFSYIYDPVAGDWNRWLQGLTQGVPLVQELTPTSILHGQVTLGGAAQQFPAGACASVTIENPITNAVVAIGNSNAVTLLLGYRLQPGATISLDIDNLNRIWVIGTAPQIISYIGVN